MITELVPPAPTTSREPLAVSVVVPTFNRRASLLRLLASLERQTLPHRRFEVVVVDNNSTDGTNDAILAYATQRRMSVRVLIEPQQGAAHARNRGIRESSAAILVFTDDDVEAEPQWLAAILRGFEELPASAIGGRTLPSWDCALPEWWLPEYEKAFLRNWGDEVCRVTEFPFFYGQNLAVRRVTLERVGGFDPRRGPKGRRYASGEDADLCRRMHDSGEALYYLPAAVVRHHVGAERLSRRYFRRRFRASGASHALQRILESRPLELPYQVKALITGLPKWLGTSFGAQRFRCELEVWYRAGFLREGIRAKLFALPRRDGKSFDL